MPLLSNSGSIGLDTSGDHESIGGTEIVQGFSAFVGKSGVYVFNLVIACISRLGQTWWAVLVESEEWAPVQFKTVRKKEQL